MENVIISGADGFVGSNTTAYFLEKNINVLALDIIEKPMHLPMHDQLTYHVCDIFNIQELKRLISGKKYDVFIHFAWRGSSGDSRKDYQLQINNALKTVEVMKAVKESGCGRFLCAGSIMEYEVDDALHMQGAAPGLGYFYGLGKYIAHFLCKTVAKEIGIDLIWPMITNAYGAGEYSARFINTTLRKMMNGEQLQFTSAEQNYDFVYVTDVAKAFYLIAKMGKPFSEYMIGSSKAGPLKNFIIEMKEAAGTKNELCFGSIPYTGVNTDVHVFSTKKLEEDCGYYPEVTFYEGIQRTYEWLKSER